MNFDLQINTAFGTKNAFHITYSKVLTHQAFVITRTKNYTYRQIGLYSFQVNSRKAKSNKIEINLQIRVCGILN
jgi:hypothetical protein